MKKRGKGEEVSSFLLPQATGKRGEKMSLTFLPNNAVGGKTTDSPPLLSGGIPLKSLIPVQTLCCPFVNCSNRLQDVTCAATITVLMDAKATKLHRTLLHVFQLRGRRSRSRCRFRFRSRCGRSRRLNDNSKNVFAILRPFCGNSFSI